ncbi:hypothetical protein R1flu_023921 [Riccia fluitans]|uniref:Uncharacterized protein n=1 Tax=Riccia fluitans TaxID=41844 RepID=A0ABD1XTE1_9MARC
MLYRAPSDPRPPLSVRYLHKLGVLRDFLDRGGSWVLQSLAMWPSFVSRNSDISIPFVICKFENLLRKTSRLDNDFALYSFSKSSPQRFRLPTPLQLDSSLHRTKIPAF